MTGAQNGIEHVQPWTRTTVGVVVLGTASEVSMPGLWMSGPWTSTFRCTPPIERGCRRVWGSGMGKMSVGVGVGVSLSVGVGAA